MAIYKKILAGDATGDEVFNLLDVLRTLKYITTPGIDIEFLAADCNGDSMITIIDALLLLSILLN